MATQSNKDALEKLREAYRSANSALVTIEQAKGRCSHDDITLGLLIMIAENVKEIRRRVNAVAKVLK
jgi:hypothetical protein